MTNLNSVVATPFCKATQAPSQLEKRQRCSTRSIFKVVCISVALALLSACAAPKAVQKTEAEKLAEAREKKKAELKAQGKVLGVLLSYEEREPGVESYINHIFVSDAYLLMQAQDEKKDYLLFDRSARTIYNVNSADRSIFVIKPQAVSGKPPMAIQYESKSQPSSLFPKIGGKSATHIRYEANHQRCYDVVSLPKDFLEDTKKALIEFRSVLAGEHAAGLKRLGSSNTEDACDLALNIFHATDHLQNGIPVREWDRKGKSRFLVNYREDHVMKADDLKVPADFKQYSIH